MVEEEEEKDLVTNLEPPQSVEPKPRLSSLSKPSPLKRQVSHHDMKKVRKVRFNPYVHRLRLPQEEAEDAQKARQSRIKEAPYHDELWDGDLYCFREKELTPEELWALKVRYKMNKIIKKPFQKGLRALQFFVPGSGEKDADTVSAHAHKLSKEGSSSNLNIVDDSIDSLIEPSPRPRQLSLDVEINEATFNRHAELVTIIKQLENMPQELTKAETQLIMYRDELADVKEELRKIRFELPELERRLSRNANPRLFHYMQLSRDEKVRKLEIEYTNLKNKKDAGQRRIEQLAMLIYEQNGKIDTLGIKLSQLRAAQDEKEDIETVVIREHGKDDPILNRTLEALDDVKKRLEKERTIEKKLRIAVTELTEKACVNGFLKSQEALLEANSFVREINPSGGANTKSPGFGRSPSLNEQAFRRESISSKSSSNGQQMRSTTSEGSFVAVKRKEALTRAREAAFYGLENLETTLDMIEDACKGNWSPNVLNWRREIPLLSHPELFGVDRRPTITDDNLDTPLVALKVRQRIEKKLAALNRLVELTNRYIDFFKREISRAAQRIAKLKDSRNEIEQELQQRRHVVFLTAKMLFKRVDRTNFSQQKKNLNSFNENEAPPLKKSVSASLVDSPTCPPPPPPESMLRRSTSATLVEVASTPVKIDSGTSLETEPSPLCCY